METKSKELATTKDLTNFRSMEELEAWGDKIASTGFTPLKKGSEVVAAVLTGKELGFGSMFSVNNIYPINGRATLGLHAINSKLLQAGIVIEVLRDFEPCVAFVMKDNDGFPVFLDDSGREVAKDDKGKPTTKPAKTIVLREGFADEPALDHEVKGKRIINWKTIIRLTRMLKQANGSYSKMVSVGEFSINQASQADLMKKDNWINYTKEMCYARALTLGGRRVADDILGGLPETSEYADVKDIDYKVEEGKVIIIEAPIKEDKQVAKDLNNIQSAEEVKEESSIVDKI